MPPEVDDEEGLLEPPKPKKPNVACAGAVPKSANVATSAVLRMLRMFLPSKNPVAKCPLPTTVQSIGQIDLNIANAWVVIVNAAGAKLVNVKSLDINHASVLSG